MKSHQPPGVLVVLAAVLLSVTLTSAAHALVVCETTVKSIMHYPHGPVMAQVRIEASGAARTWNICSTKVDEGALTVDQCFRFLDTLNVSIGLGSRLRFYFLDSVPDANGVPTTSCEQVRQWGPASLATFTHAYQQFAP